MVGLPDQYGLLQPPQETGLLGINERLSSLATDPLFNIGIGMLGSRSPHFGNALAAGGQQLQQGVMLGERMKDQSSNRDYRKQMLELAKARQNQDPRLTTAINNAKFMFPNDPVRQQQAVQEMLFKETNGQLPASLQEMQWLEKATPEQRQLYFQNKRAGNYIDTGRGKEYFSPDNPMNGNVLQGSSQADLMTNAATEAFKKAEAAKQAETQAKIQADAPAAYSNMMAGLSEVQAVKSKIDALKGDPNLSSITGWQANVPTLRPQSRATEALVNELKSGIAIQALIDAKSKGATFGALSDTELGLLKDEIAALDLGMDDASFKKQLDKVENHMNMIESNIRRAYESQYGKGGGFDMPPEQPQTKDKVINWDDL